SGRREDFQRGDATEGEREGPLCRLRLGVLVPVEGAGGPRRDGPAGEHRIRSKGKTGEKDPGRRDAPVRRDRRGGTVRAREQRRAAEAGPRERGEAGARPARARARG